jgi:hypothetical protein
VWSVTVSYNKVFHKLLFPLGLYVIIFLSILLWYYCSWYLVILLKVTDFPEEYTASIFKAMSNLKMVAINSSETLVTNCNTYVESQQRRPLCTFSSPWKCQTSCIYSAGFHCYYMCKITSIVLYNFVTAWIFNYSKISSDKHYEKHPNHDSTNTQKIHTDIPRLSKTYIYFIHTMWVWNSGYEENHHHDISLPG